VTAGAQDRSAVLLTVEATGIRKNWNWFVALRIVQIIAGTLAVGGRSGQARSSGQ
jgi:hypothetical protein